MSSPYVSATEEVDSESADDSPRMTLAPSGAAMLRNRAERTKSATTVSTGSTKIAVADQKAHSPEKLESFFQSAMERVLKEQQAPQARFLRQESTTLTTSISVNQLVQRLQRRR
ncbi:hypothetical protein PF004_g26383 [Phytophthora fragariae]|uniref:Uncharacterized protein n=1 Tax=Phytophthora fragariae TaxID=53985 RepID=A0A6G0MNJ7_9STRA|nr:hypothetical protein PF004_g26383 [Phytophthora fragariae]